MSRYAGGKSVLNLYGHLGLPEMVYLPASLASAHRGLPRDSHMEVVSELTILESEHPWDTFRRVYTEELWDSARSYPYFPLLPMKRFDADTLSSRSIHSGRWHPVEHRIMHIRPFRLLMS